MEEYDSPQILDDQAHAELSVLIENYKEAKQNYETDVKMRMVQATQSTLRSAQKAEDALLSLNPKDPQAQYISDVTAAIQKYYMALAQGNQPRSPTQLASAMAQFQQTVLTATGSSQEYGPKEIQEMLKIFDPDSGVNQFDLQASLFSQDLAP
jgi:hypothetical protein